MKEDERKGIIVIRKGEVEKIKLKRKDLIEKKRIEEEENIKRVEEGDRLRM